MSCLPLFHEGITLVAGTGPQRQRELPLVSLFMISRVMCTHMLAYLYHSGSHADFNTHVATVQGRLTLTAAFSGTQVKNVAFRLKSLPTHVLEHVIRYFIFIQKQKWL